MNSVTVGSGGTITVALNATKVASGNVVLTPTNTGGSVTWKCTGTVPAKYLPSNCR